MVSPGAECHWVSEVLAILDHNLDSRLNLRLLGLLGPAAPPCQESTTLAQGRDKAAAGLTDAWTQLRVRYAT